MAQPPPLIDPSFGDDGTKPKDKELRPNPSLAGTSLYPHPAAWLIREFSILSWWLVFREQAGTMPVLFFAPSYRDMDILSAEKQIMEWWWQAGIREVLI